MAVSPGTHQRQAHVREAFFTSQAGNDLGVGIEADAVFDDSIFRPPRGGDSMPLDLL